MIFLRRRDVQRLQGSEVLAAWPNRNSHVERRRPARHQVRARSDQFHQHRNLTGDPTAHPRITTACKIIPDGAGGCHRIPFSPGRRPANLDPRATRSALCHAVRSRVNGSAPSTGQPGSCGSRPRRRPDQRINRDNLATWTLRQTYACSNDWPDSLPPSPQHSHVGLCYHPDLGVLGFGGGNRRTVPWRVPADGRAGNRARGPAGRVRTSPSRCRVR